jgi:hypothetical protein
MRQRQFFGIALLVGATLIAAAWHGSAADEKVDPAPRAANSKARRDAAKKVYEGSWQHYVKDAESGRGEIEYYHDWSVRWLQAERDLSQTKREQIIALEGHLKRMQIWKERVDDSVKEGTAPRYLASAAEFFCLEAEDWLAAAKAELK